MIIIISKEVNLERITALRDLTSVWGRKMSIQIKMETKKSEIQAVVSARVIEAVIWIEAHIRNCLFLNGSATYKTSWILQIVQTTVTNSPHTKYNEYIGDLTSYKERLEAKYWSYRKYKVFDSEELVTSRFYVCFNRIAVSIKSNTLCSGRVTPYRTCQWPSDSH